MKATTPRIGSSSEPAEAITANIEPPIQAPATLGLEIEMPVACDQSGASRLVHRYFDALKAIKMQRGERITEDLLAGRCIGLKSSTSHCGLDNGYNLLETALQPIRNEDWRALAARAHRELADSIDALQADSACVLNVAQHPDCPRDANWYGKACVPRPIYRELLSRGWHHWEGIDGKAQNGANTGVSIAHATRALNVVLGLAPASIALFANSPLESGRPSGYKETRMTLWPRVFKPAHYAGDRKVATYPSRPFHDLADFFSWMLGPGTTVRALPEDATGDYKAAQTVMPCAAPSLYDFLRKPSWSCRDLEGRRAPDLIPQPRHFEYGQIGQFLDARLRYAWAEAPTIEKLLESWDAGELEALFESCGADVYIEARAPGANFADASIVLEAGERVARSVLVAPLAVQTGLINCLEESWQLVLDWGWTRLGELRMRAIRQGLDDPEVLMLARQVVQVAAKGLAGRPAGLLSYAEFVVDTGRSAADRQLDSWHGRAQDGLRGLPAILARHRACHPREYGAL